jgi:signal peptidase I
VARAASFLSIAALALPALALIAYAALPIAGYKATVITGGSMAPAIGTGAITISRHAEAAGLAVGDIIAYQTDEGKTRITHRILSVRTFDGEQLFTMKGDANASPDAGELRLANGADTVALTLPRVGYAIAFMVSPVGMMIMLLGMPALALLLLKPGVIGGDEGAKE